MCEPKPICVECLRFFGTGRFDPPELPDGERCYFCAKVRSDSAEKEADRV